MKECRANNTNIVISPYDKYEEVYSEIVPKHFIHDSFNKEIISIIKEHAQIYEEKNLEHSTVLIIDEFKITMYCSEIFDILTNGIDLHITNIFVCQHFDLVPTYLLKLFDYFFMTTSCDDYTANIFCSYLIPHADKKFLKEKECIILGKKDFINTFKKKVIDKSEYKKPSSMLQNIMHQFNIISQVSHLVVDKVNKKKCDSIIKIPNINDQSVNELIVLFNKLDLNKKQCTYNRAG